MTEELPIKLRQLINVTAAELGLGEVEKVGLEISFYRAYALGITRGKEITEDEFQRNKSHDRRID